MIEKDPTTQDMLQDDPIGTQPRILEAANNGDGPDLDPDKVTGGATVRIDGWPGIAVNQYVWLRLKGHQADGSAHDRTVWTPPSRVTQSEYTNGYLRASVPYAYLQDLGDGSELTVEFKVSFTGSTDEVQAVIFPLRIYTIRSAFEQSRPRILEASNNGHGPDLDLGNVTDGANVRIDGWPDIAVGQYVWLRLKGRKADGSVHDLTIWMPPSRVTQTEFARDYLRATVPYAYLRELDGGRLTVEFKVSFTGSTDEAQATIFPVRVYTVGELEALETLDLSQEHYVVVADKPPPVVPAYARMTLTFTWGSPPYRYGSSSDYVASVDAQSGEVTAMGNGQCTITATDSQGEARSYALTVKGIRQLYYLSSSADWQGMVLVCSVADLDPVTLVDIKQLWTLYNPGNGRVAEYLGWLSYPFWTGDKLGAGTAWAYDLNGDSVNDNATAFSTDTYLPVLGISRDT